MVRLVTFGLVGLGRSGMQRQEAQFEATIRTVLHGNHKVAVLGKGGVGKTSVAACVGSILAELRQQDRIVGIDADTAFGRLSSRIDPRAAGSFWELTTDTNLRSFTDITARLGRNSAGLYVLAGQPASGPRRVLDPAIYREAALRLDHHFAISVIDCGSSMEAAVTQEVLRDVDALIVVSSPWADGASAAANTIEWLSDYGMPISPSAMNMGIKQIHGTATVYLDGGKFVALQSPDPRYTESMYYIDPQGVRYGVPNAETAKSLGLSSPQNAPWEIVRLLVDGPVLSKDAALLEHDTLPADPSPRKVPAGASGAP